MNNIKSYITMVICGALLWTMVSHAGIVWDNYLECQDRMEEAEALLNSDACRNPMKRAKLNSMCNQKEKVRKTPLAVCTMLSSAQELKICPKDSCYIFATNVTQQLPKIAFVVTLTIFLLLWASSKTISNNNKQREVDRWSLPIGTYTIRDKRD